MSDTAVQQSAASESVTEGSLLDQVMANSRMAPADEGYDVARKGVATFIANLLKSDEKGQPVNKALVDQMVVELDRKISAQMDEILHAPKLQELESSWRGLKLMVDRTDFRENIKVDILHATKTELLEDFEFAPDVTQTGFYKHIYSTEYGQFGGEPVGAVVGNYAFTPSTPDIQVHGHLKPQLQRIGSLGQINHIHPLHPGFELLDALPDRATDLDAQIVGAERGVVEVQQAQIRHAGAVARVGVQQPNQMALDGFNNVGDFSHTLAGRFGSLLQSLEQAAAAGLRSVAGRVLEHGLILVQPANQ